MMKKIILFKLFFLTGFLLNAQERLLPTLTDMTAILRTGDIKKMSRLVDSLNYIVVDSAVMTDGRLSFISKEPVLIGWTTLGCWTNKKRVIEGISLKVRSRSQYDKLLAEMNRLGFKATGPKSKGASEGELSQDYEKGKILISTVTSRAALGWQFEFYISNMGI
ncbi:MAG: hypothetical protein IAE96_05735 [Chitinophagaceae bacterium]|nr:hypothetical protein [Chitinophagaceae bacterium]